MKTGSVTQLADPGMLVELMTGIEIRLRGSRMKIAPLTQVGLKFLTVDRIRIVHSNRIKDKVRPTIEKILVSWRLRKQFINLVFKIGFANRMRIKMTSTKLINLVKRKDLR